LNPRTWRRWGDVADVVNGPTDPEWDADREAIAHELRQADVDDAAGKTVSRETALGCRDHDAFRATETVVRDEDSFNLALATATR
jgi:hypothetical protein